MPAAFRPAANLIAKLAVGGLMGLVIVVVALVYGIPYMDYNTWRNLTRPQPVPFSHKHHVSGLGLDCRYCHTEVEASSTAGLPPAETCMTCHSQVWADAPALAPERQSFASGEPLAWNRINQLPDYVFFDHSIHVVKGIGCTTCHGPIGNMPLVRKVNTLYMGWCLECHRDPAPYLRPRAAVFDPHWQRSPGTPSGQQLMARYDIHPEALTDCSVCHR